MTKMLSLLPEEMTDGALTRVKFTPERLERAKERLAGADVIGLQEEFEGFWRELASRFGWPPGDHARHRARPPAELSPAFRDRILTDNADDLELYEFARRLVAHRSQVAT